MNKKNTATATATSTANNKKEKTTMKTIFDAIQYVKSEEFKFQKKESFWNSPIMTKSWETLFGQDDIFVITVYSGVLKDAEFNRIVRDACEFGDSKRRCAELKAAFNRGDFICKKGHIDGRLVIVVQLLVD